VSNLNDRFFSSLKRSVPKVFIVALIRAERSFYEKKAEIHSIIAVISVIYADMLEPERARRQGRGGCAKPAAPAGVKAAASASGMSVTRKAVEWVDFCVVYRARMAGRMRNNCFIR